MGTLERDADWQRTGDVAWRWPAPFLMAIPADWGKALNRLPAAADLLPEAIRQGSLFLIAPG
jgi:hypothetical protein